MRLVSLGLLAAAILPLASLRADPGQTLAGPDFAGWSFVSPASVPLASVAHPQPDGAIALEGKPLGYVQTARTWTNFRLHVEWRWTGRPGNGGILVAIATGPVDRHLWPRCLQIQTKHGRAGDLLPMAAATFAEPLSTPPDAATPIRDRVATGSEKPAGEWNACDVVARDGTFEVRINGVLQNQATHCDPAAGRIGLQFEGAPYAVRNLRIEALP
jgi:hypothetical protein